MLSRFLNSVFWIDNDLKGEMSLLKGLEEQQFSSPMIIMREWQSALNRQISQVQLQGELTRLIVLFGLGPTVIRATTKPKGQLARGHRFPLWSQLWISKSRKTQRPANVFDKLRRDKTSLLCTVETYASNFGFTL